MSKYIRLCGTMYDGGLLGYAGTREIIIPDKPKKRLSQRLSKTDSQTEGKKNALESPNLPERKV